MAVGFKLRVEGKLLGRDTRVYLDDVDISHGLTGLDIHIDVNQANRAELSILVSDLELDAEALATLTAYLGEKRQRMDGTPA